RCSLDWSLPQSLKTDQAKCKKVIPTSRDLRSHEDDGGTPGAGRRYHGARRPKLSSSRTRVREAVQVQVEPGHTERASEPDGHVHGVGPEQLDGSACQHDELQH